LKFQLAIVAFIAAILLAYGLDRASVGTAYSDPVGKIRAQDESSFANSALTMAHDGGWLTPRVLGRYLMQKPPLLLWLSGAALKIFGRSLWALRWPALAAAVFAVTLVFSWMRRERSWVAACIAAILLLSNPLWHIFARLCYTDMLWTAAMTAAIAILAANPRLDTRLALCGFAVAVSASVMVKSVSGLLPLAVLGLLWLVARGADRPAFARVALAAAIVLMLVAPWHIYQLAAHRQWFWADYVQTQLLGFGFRPPIATSGDAAPLFYAKRLWLTDPVLIVLLLIGLPALIRDRQKKGTLLLALWMAVNIAALLAFGFRNLPYALIVLPPAALIAARALPPKSARWAAIALAAIFVVKCYFASQPWGLAFGAVDPLPSVAGMRWYHDLGRSNELMIADADDSFYSETLGLPHVRYYLVDPSDTIRKFVSFYGYLGIMLSEDEFERLGEVTPGYAARLKDWGLDSTEPIGTTIVGISEAGLMQLVKTRPDIDFSITSAELAMLSAANALAMHHVERTQDDRAFLLSSKKEPSRPVEPLPAHW